MQACAISCCYFDISLVVILSENIFGLFSWKHNFLVQTVMPEGWFWTSAFILTK